MTERLFFALWPDDSVRQAINPLSQPVIQSLTGKAVVPDNWHITLAFLGEVENTARPCLHQAAASVQASHFSLCLDKLGYWPHNKILWLGSRETPNALQTLVTQLTTGLQTCGYRPEKRPFQVHLTLMRKAARAKTLPPVAPVIWRVADVCLVRSRLDSGGAHYETIARWSLH